MADAEKTRTEQMVSNVLVIVLLALIPLQCHRAKQDERKETEAVCRRAIERKFSLPAEEAKKLVDDQRVWEGR